MLRPPADRPPAMQRRHAPSLTATGHIQARPLAAWWMSKPQAGLIATASLILWAVGGWIVGILAAPIGRVKGLQITIAWFSVCTFVSAFTNSFEQLLIVRGLQGLGFGGEWAVGSVLIAETIRAKHRGKAVGTVQSGWAVNFGRGFAAFTPPGGGVHEQQPAARPRHRNGDGRRTRSCRVRLAVPTGDARQGSAGLRLR